MDFDSDFIRDAQDHEDRCNAREEKRMARIEAMRADDDNLERALVDRERDDRRDARGRPCDGTDHPHMLNQCISLEDAARISADAV